MKEGPDIARVAALIGDPARANMLTALMSGRALTARELAAEAGVTAQTASAHLGKLEEGGIVRVQRQGRHKYVALAGDEVAAVLEGLMGLAAGAGHLRTRPGPKDAALREARRCYNHLAGDRGVQMYDAMRRRDWLTEDEGLVLSEAGRGFITDFGIDLRALEAKGPPICRDCLDWSERRAHLGGRLGRAMLDRMEALGWLSRSSESRVVRFSDNGRVAFDEAFPVSR
ncbi:ArsR/SmtB family transcription factor [Aestuariibius sp. 2305UL40-4]|uniref:ArsR/SmtB family transcription factor n=1 Tax=Aestuariibius violaceus TaxID=3234132 RepID=UPI00345E4433